jgi:glycosyltransferase involved in cell wall biosynthesis
VLKKPLLVQVLGDWKKAVLFAGPPGPIRTFKSWLGNWMTRTAVSGAGLVFTQGHALFDQCRAINPHATKCDMVHSTITQEEFFQRAASGFHKPLRILTVSRLEPGKGLDILAKSLRILIESGFNVEWWCVGRGESEQALKVLTESLGMSECVRFIGYVSHGAELFELYRRADIFVLPSFHEGIPNVILEAMAHSMPIVATDVGSVCQVIRNGVEGVLTPPGEPKSLAEAILRLANNDIQAYLMGKAALQRARSYEADSFSGLHSSFIETAFGAIDFSRTAAPAFTQR